MNMKTISNKTFSFGSASIPTSHIFLIRTNVFAFVNIKPLCPGHVLVSSIKSVSRLSDLTESETLDIWLTVQQVSKAMSELYKKEVTVCVQDGPEAGQTVPQVHFHIIPSGRGEKRYKIEPDVERKPRNDDEMSEEAGKYRALFEQQN